MTNCRRFIGALVVLALSIPSAAMAQFETAGEAEPCTTSRSGSNLRR